MVLCDLALPELDGPGLYAELERSDPDLLGRFVIVSANAESPKYLAWLARTRVPVISKPFDQSEIFATICGKDPALEQLLAVGRATVEKG